MEKGKSILLYHHREEERSVSIMLEITEVDRFFYRGTSCDLVCNALSLPHGNKRMTDKEHCSHVKLRPRLPAGRGGMF